MKKQLFLKVVLIISFFISVKAMGQSISAFPNTARQNSYLAVTISGSGTTFGQGSSCVCSSCTDISGLQLNFQQGSATIFPEYMEPVSGSTEVNAYFSIPANVPVGAYKLSTGNYVNCPLYTSFEITAAPSQNSFYVSPGQAGLGQTLSVMIVGNGGTNFGQGSSCICPTCFDVSPSNITFTQGSQTIHPESTKILSNEVVAAKVKIPYNAKPGSYNLTVGTPGICSMSTVFNVKPEYTSISASPSVALPGQSLAVTISGGGVLFTQGSPCSTPGAISVPASDVYFTQGSATVFGQGSTTIFNQGSSTVFGQGSSTIFNPQSTNWFSQLQDFFVANVSVPNDAAPGVYDIHVGNAYCNNIICSDCFEIKPTVVNSLEVVSISDTILCAGEDMFLMYEAKGNYGGSNSFQALLSDSTGSFNNPDYLGAGFSPGINYIKFTLPRFKSGAHYRVKVVSTEPYYDGPSYPVDVKILKNDFNYSYNSQQICAGDSIRLVASGALSYNWSDGNSFISNQSSIIVHPDKNSFYYVTGLVAGCKNVSGGNIFVAVHPKPNLIASSSKSVTCADEPLMLNAVASSGTLPYVYVWNPISVLDSLNPSPVVNPSVSTVYTAWVSDAHGCSDMDTTVVTISANQVLCNMVWPGDADENFVVNTYDLFPIGLNFGKTGSARTSVSNEWQGFYASNWNDVQKNGLNLKYADCNGDGIIGITDTVAVYQNYNLPHNKTENVYQYNSANSDLYIVKQNGYVQAGQVFRAEIWAGSATAPVKDLYGIGFKIGYNTSIVEPGTVKLTFAESWLADANSISVDTTLEATGIIDATIVRTDNTNKSGYGKIADLEMKIKAGTSVSSELNMRFTDYKAVESTGSAVAFNPVNPNIVTGINTESENDFSIYPNPTTGMFTVALNAAGIVTVSVTNILGENVLSQSLVVNGQQSIPLKINAQAGIYLVKVQTPGLTFVKRLVVRN